MSGAFLNRGKFDDAYPGEQQEQCLPAASFHLARDFVTKLEADLLRVCLYVQEGQAGNA